MFEFPCNLSLYYIKNQQDATLAVLFISDLAVTNKQYSQSCILLVLYIVYQNQLLHEILSYFINSWRGAFEVYNAGLCDSLPSYLVEQQTDLHCMLIIF